MLSYWWFGVTSLLIGPGCTEFTQAGGADAAYRVVLVFIILFSSLVNKLLFTKVLVSALAVLWVDSWDASYLSHCRYCISE